jgi:predicted DCC family thiol-disulfide oxidoreductase YuxK
MTGRGPGTLTLFYDADCGVCRLTVLALLRLDRRHRLAAVPLQAYDDAEPTRRELEAELHVRDGAGRWSRGGDAALRIAGAVPVLVPLAIIGRLPGMRRVARAAYRLVAEHRPAISRAFGLESSADRLRHGRGSLEGRPGGRPSHRSWGP